MSSDELRSALLSCSANDTTDMFAIGLVANTRAKVAAVHGENEPTSIGESVLYGYISGFAIGKLAVAGQSRHTEFLQASSSKS